MVDINFDHTPASPSKLMTLQGVFACQTAQATSLPYPTSLGNCAVLLDNSVRLQLLYTGPPGAPGKFPDQINFLMPATLSTTAHELRVTRQDANGTFTSGPLI